jgi:hypothetical protein
MRWLPGMGIMKNTLAVSNTKIPMRPNQKIFFIIEFKLKNSSLIDIKED